MKHFSVKKLPLKAVAYKRSQLLIPITMKQFETLSQVDTFLTYDAQDSTKLEALNKDSRRTKPQQMAQDSPITPTWLNSQL